AIAAELALRITAVMTSSGARWSTIGVDCDASGAWIVWFDGSRALVDQRMGLVPGAVALVETRLAYDRTSAAYPGVEQPAIDPGPRPDLEMPPSDDVAPEPTKTDRKAATEGGIGLGFATAFWGSDATGIGPRL